MKSFNLKAAAFGLCATIGFAGWAHADTFATYNPVNTSANMSLSGANLTASAPVTFNYLTTDLAPFGDLAATLTLNAVETGALQFGPLALATFDGEFAINYTGATTTIGSITIHNGDDLLSGIFLDGVFNGYGSAGSLLDSILGGGLVSYSSDLLTFDSGSDQGLTIGFSSGTPSFLVHNGQLNDFSAVTQGEFSADTTLMGGGGVPEPAAWALMLLGFGGIGIAARRRARASAA